MKITYSLIPITHSNKDFFNAFHEPIGELAAYLSRTKFIMKIKRSVWLAALAGILLLNSCDRSEAANQMADEMCLAMEKYEENDPMTMLSAANEMMLISKKTKEYGQVTDAQLKKAMLKKCPEGWRKFENLKGK